MYKNDATLRQRGPQTHSYSLERGLLDGPRLVGLGLLELGKPVRHLLPSFARDPCEGGRTLLVVVGVPEGQRGALGARTPRPADAMDVPELGIGIGLGFGFGLGLGLG